MENNGFDRFMNEWSDNLQSKRLDRLALDASNAKALFSAALKQANTISMPTDFDLINIPVKVTRYINIYRNDMLSEPYFGGGRLYKEAAQSKETLKDPQYVTTLKIEFDDPNGSPAATKGKIRWMNVQRWNSRKSGGIGAIDEIIPGVQFYITRQDAIDHSTSDTVFTIPVEIPE